MIAIPNANFASDGRDRACEWSHSHPFVSGQPCRVLPTEYRARVQLAAQSTAGSRIARPGYASVIQEIPAGPVTTKAPTFPSS